MRHRRLLVSFALIAPFALFLLVNFLAPIGLLLSRSVVENELATAWPNTAPLLREWDGSRLPDAPLAETFARELKASRTAGTLSAIANRLNYDIPGLRSLLFRTARGLAREETTADLNSLLAIDTRWGQRETWAAMRGASGPVTSFYLLAALDRRKDADGDIVNVPEERAVFGGVFLRTFAIAATVTLACVLLGYPLSYWLAHLKPWLAAPLLMFVLLPLWTSVLVRTTAWIVLLQRNGVINGWLERLGIISEPLQIMYNRLGVCIAMTHVLLPYMVLPLFGVMRHVHPARVRAALSLGATPWRAFWNVYVPDTMPGVMAGALIVFILALGYYVTPALVGGAGDQMIAYFVAMYTNETLNWGLAAALSLVLLVSTLLLYAVYSRLARNVDLAWR